MAIMGSTEVEIVGPGVRQTSPEKSSFALNTVFNNRAWEVRKGFGQLGEWDSTLSRYTEDPGNLVETEGYSNHLGSYLMKTNFGHTQIISVFLMGAWTSDGQALPDFATNFDNLTRRLPLYAVSIYDVTTDTRWEEVICHTTAEMDPTISEMPNWYGYMSSTFGRLSGSVLTAPSDQQINFVELNDILFFGNEGIGLMYYLPSAFIGNRSKALNPMLNQTDVVYSEPSTIERLVLSPGSDGGTESYDPILPKINCIGKLNDRLVLASDQVIHFSNPIPESNSVMTDNILKIPSENIITAVAEINGNLLIWTKSETFLYQPSTGKIVVDGQLTKISSSIGCLSSNSFIIYENKIVWVDQNGVHVNSGDLAVNTLSDNIRKFFTDYISNPLSHFELKAGSPNLENSQPKIQYSLNPKNVTICYAKKLRALIITVPEQRCSLLINENGEWSMWIYDSAAFYDNGVPGALNEVGLRTHMDARQLLSDENELYSIGLDLDSKLTTDYASTWDSATSSWDVIVRRHQPFKSYFICRYGRGGGCDRNVDNEDYRYGIGEWTYAGLSTQPPPAPFAGTPYPGADQTGIYAGEAYFIIGKPQKIAPGFIIDTHIFGDNGGVLVPIYGKAPVTGTPWNAELLQAFELQFEFDRLHWTPLYDAGTAKCQFIEKTPLENAQSGYGNGNVGFVMNQYQEIQTYNATTGVLDATTNGGLMRIGWNMIDAGAPAPAFGMQHFFPMAPLLASPALQCPFPMNKERLTLLCWIPFEPVDHGGIQESTSKMNIRNMNGAMWLPAIGTVPAKPPTGNFYRTWNYVWNFSSLGESDDIHKEDKVAQGVDWAYSSVPIGLDDGNQIKARGVYSQILSHGTATNPIDNGWNPAVFNGRRLFNSTVSNDNTQWMGQVSDFVGPDPLVAGRTVDPTNIDPAPPVYNGTIQGPGGIAGSKNTIRTRIRNSTNQLGYNTFNDGAQTWGQDGTTNGTVLIDDPQFGTIAESNSTRGEWVNWMFFGHVLDKAEKLIIKSAKAVVRIAGGRRRKGR